MSTLFRLTACISVATAIRIRIRSDVLAEEPFSWDDMLTNLTNAKSLWEANGITEYAYQYKTMCYCMPCTLMPKFVYIEDGVAKDVEFDTQSMMEYDEYYTSQCNDSSIYQPIDKYYHTIDYYYDRAIKFAREGASANCSNDTSSFYQDLYCGGTIDFEYDSTLYYPTKISLIYGPMVADGDMDYEFGCLTVMDTESNNTNLNLSAYDGECSNYSRPANDSQLCACTMEWFPYCCGGELYGNKCQAECDGHYVYTDCVQSICNDTKPGDKGPGDKGAGGKSPGSDDSDESPGEKGPSGPGDKWPGMNSTGLGDLECDFCYEIYYPYCCDGQLYDNDCYALCGGFDVLTDCNQTEECDEIDGMNNGVGMPSVGMFIHIICFILAMYSMC